MFDETQVEIDCDDATLARIDAVMHKHLNQIVSAGELEPELLMLGCHRTVMGLILHTMPRNRWGELARLYGAAFVQQVDAAGALVDAEDETLQ
jgi:hypothetical protein